MGEQRPLEMLNAFVGSALALDRDGERVLYSRPDLVTDSYEARRYLAPRRHVRGEELRAQTEVYEYHWAHLMQGNRLDDMWPTLKRILLQWPWRVPPGIRVIWLLVWAALGAGVWAFVGGPFSDIDLSEAGAETLVRALLGGGLVALILTYVVARVLPSWITTSFVDVVRYLDTSPRSYEVRKRIRKGMVDLLLGLHESGRYDRIVVVAHSLGGYIAYDGITYAWGRMNAIAKPTADVGDPGVSPEGLAELERAASKLVLENTESPLTEFRKAQRRLWLGLRKHGNPWLVTDLITVGTPMYFADRLYTKNRDEFDERVKKRELPTAPPQSDESVKNNINGTDRWFSWNNRGARVLYHGAPFAVVRWTNMWFPARAGFFGDWFGGPLAGLFGPGIRDIPITGNTPWRWLPGFAHTLYFRFANDTTPDSATTPLRDSLDLASTDWLTEDEE